MPRLSKILKNQHVSVAKMFSALCRKALVGKMLVTDAFILFALNPTTCHTNPTFSSMSYRLFNNSLALSCRRIPDSLERDRNRSTWIIPRPLSYLRSTPCHKNFAPTRHPDSTSSSSPPHFWQNTNPNSRIRWLLRSRRWSREQRWCWEGKRRRRLGWGRG